VNSNNIPGVASEYSDHRTLETLLATADDDLLASLTETAKTEKDCSDARLNAALLAADDDLLTALRQRTEHGDAGAGTSSSTPQTWYPC
jgi:hypothetical protein